MIEFLRVLYTREVRLDEDLAMKLVQLADKYVQSDLSEKCLDFLKFTINFENIYKRLEFAYEQNLDDLKNFCKNYLKRNLDAAKILDYLQFLEKNSDPELKVGAVSYIVNNFYTVCQEYEKKWQSFEDFLVKSVDTSTISLLVKLTNPKDSGIITTTGLIYTRTGGWEDLDKAMEKRTVNLKQACLTFAQKNFRKLREKNICQEFPNSFLMELVFIVFPTSNPQ